MSLVVKFNIIFAIAFLLGGSGAAYFTNKVLMDSARDQVKKDAGLLMDTAICARQYTAEDVGPIIKAETNRRMRLAQVIRDANEKDPNLGLNLPAKDQGEQASQNFHPETVPAFAATSIFAKLEQEYPEYRYREATLNPTNTQDQANDFETSIIQQLKDHPDQKEIPFERVSETGTIFGLARPLVVSSIACMECHSTPDVAPKAMVSVYGPKNGFGWKMNDTIGAQIIEVPMTATLIVAQKPIISIIVATLCVYILVMALLNFTLIYTVIRPIRRLSALADDISKGKSDIPEIVVTGKDEISALTASFRRMHLSLAKALKMLED
jgi:protein-histidine pros-kinase